MDIEHKLELIQQIHREQEENERYIYENLKSRNYSREFYDYDAYGQRKYRKVRQVEENVPDSWIQSFRLRLLLSVLLFLCFFIMEKKEIEFGEVSYTKIIENVGKNMDFEDLASYYNLTIMKKNL